MGGLSKSQFNLLMDLLGEYNKILYLQEMFWGQKDYVNWLKHGDSNTRYFYRSTILRRRQNRICGIMDEQGKCMKIIMILLAFCLIIFNKDGHVLLRWRSLKIILFNQLSHLPKIIS